MSRAPMSFIIAISSFLTEIPTVMVFEMRKIETRTSIRTTTIEIKAMRLLKSVRVFAVSSD